MRLREQIDDLFIVNLDEGSPHLYTTLLLSLLNLPEYLVNGSRNDPNWSQVWEVWGSCAHGECLTALSKGNEYCRFVHRQELRHCSHRSNLRLVLVCTAHRQLTVGNPLWRLDRTCSCDLLRWPIPHRIGNLYNPFSSSPFRWMAALGLPPSLWPSGLRACPLALPTNPFEL